MHRSRVLRRVGLGIAILLVFVVVAAGVATTGLVRQSWPTTSGQLQIDGLTSPVIVQRDARGVPTITADNAIDLFRAQGFVAAQDRMFQMDLWRHVTAGRLAELVGQAGVDSDRVVRTMGWRRVAAAELPLLSPATRSYLTAYADGVNAYLAQRGNDPAKMGLEYVALGQAHPGYRMEPWTPTDSLAWLKAMAWDLRADFDGELTRARLAATLDPAMVAVLYPQYPADTNPPILSPQDWSPSSAAAASSVPSAFTDGATSTGAMRSQAALAGPTLLPTRAQAASLLGQVAAATEAIPDLIGARDSNGIGSNSWVVSGRLTSTGKPLLANDPHLATQLPGIWSQVGLRCRSVSSSCPFDVTGFTFAGFPGVVIGHNDTIAWGFTNLGADVTDLYYERISDSTYLRDGKQVPLDSRTEVIKVAGGDDVTITVRSTVHGPVISDAMAAVADAGAHPVIRDSPQLATYAVALAWTALTPRPTADAVFALDTAKTFVEFRAAAAKFAVPAQNLIYADTAGNIGYQAPGAIPVRRTSTPNTPPGYSAAPGWDSQFDWTGYVPFDSLPYAYNPPEGYLVTANQEVTASSTPFLTTEWDQGYRSARIRDLIRTATTTGTGKITPAQMAAIQMDTRNPFAATLVPQLVSINLNDAPMAKAAQQLLYGWDDSQPADDSAASASAAFYNVVWSRLLRDTFDDQLPPDLAASGDARWMGAMATLLKDPSNTWWDDVTTPGVIEGRDEILRRAMVQAALELTQRVGKDPSSWSWGKLHTLTLTHQVLGGDGAPDLLKPIFNRGPISLPGGPAIVDANGWDASKGYTVTSAPSMRMVVDLGSLDSSHWVNQTGQSGHQYDSHYVDQVDAWAAGESFPWPFSRAAVDAATATTLTLTPKS